MIFFNNFASIFDYIKIEMKKLVLIMILLTACICNADAVLTERNLDKTLSFLRQELEAYHAEQKKHMQKVKALNVRVRDELMSIVGKSNQNALILYSQSQSNTFDMTYACHEATELYKNFDARVLPFAVATEKLTGEIARYDSMIVILENMPVIALDEKAQTDRNVCLTLATNIRNNLVENSESLSQYTMFFDKTSSRLKQMNDYAQVRYRQIQSSIFVNGDESFISILGKLPLYLVQTKQAIDEKYGTDKYRKQKDSTKTFVRNASEWHPFFIVFFFSAVLFWFLVSSALNIIAYRWLLPKRIQQIPFVSEKRESLSLASILVTLGVALIFVRLRVEQHFLVTAANLMLEFVWLSAVICISLLLRLRADQMRSGYRIYLPLLVVGFVVISYRIVLIPNELVNLTFPILLLLCAIWQWVEIRKHQGNLPKSDIFYTWVSQIVFISSLVASWIGYSLLSVQLLIWWIMELTFILTITCITDWLSIYEEKKNFKNKNIKETWRYDLLLKVILPWAAIVAFIFSIYWAADLFNLSYIFKEYFFYEFLKTKSITLSLFRLSVVVMLYFLFKYILATSKAVLHMHFEDEEGKKAQSKEVMGKNVLQVLVWGVYLIISFNILELGSEWLLVITGGLSTGIGFASKDILENIYYGISLMTGRINIGDMIECDGTRGTVRSINYTSTMIEAVDGSVIAFQNSQLFTKNYKNLTRNHSLELAQVPFGIAYGSNVAEVKNLIADAVMQLDCYDKSRGVSVVFVDFGDSSVDLKVLVWVRVEKKLAVTSIIKECIYDTLNANGIEIPFPQRDIYIKNATELKNS